MKICIEGLSPIFKDQVIEIITNIEYFDFKYLENDKPKPTTYVFETDSDDVDEAIKAIKAKIKNSKNGSIIAFRVVPYGKKIYYVK